MTAEAFSGATKLSAVKLRHHIFDLNRLNRDSMIQVIVETAARSRREGILRI